MKLKLLTVCCLSGLAIACSGGGGGGGNHGPAEKPKAQIKPEAKPKTEQSKPELKQPQSEKKPEIQPKPEALPQPEAKPDVQPQQPETPPQKQNNKISDEQALQNLGLPYASKDNGEFSSVLNTFTLMLENKNIDLKLMDENKYLFYKDGKQLETLRDKDGNLVGYYGYAVVGEKYAKNGYEELDGITFSPYLLQNTDDSQKQKPITTANYSGKMFYRHKGDSQLEVSEAEVNATFNAQDNTVSMNLRNNEKDDRWYLHEGNAFRNAKNANPAHVNEDGSFSGTLLKSESDKLTQDGNFSGGFFGKDGSVLTGRAEGQNWKGVVGATVENK
ncbi:hypothetical protein RYD26_05925 [Pasteurellaceae bacterium LIM206]|nr:hypothetical protein [Pasteurellaceae bacterium LIM206]